MKFVMVIANEEYQSQVEEIFAHLQCHATMIASTGDFLQYGEIIYLLGIEEMQKEALFQLCGKVFLEDCSLIGSRVRIYSMNINHFLKCRGGISAYDREESDSTKFPVEGSRE